MGLALRAENAASQAAGWWGSTQSSIISALGVLVVAAVIGVGALLFVSNRNQASDSIDEQQTRASTTTTQVDGEVAVGPTTQDDSDDITVTTLDNEEPGETPGPADDITDGVIIETEDPPADPPVDQPYSCLNGAGAGSQEQCPQLTTAEFNEIQRLATQACSDAVGRHGETYEVFDRFYVISELQWLIDNGQHSGALTDGTILLSGDNGNNLIVGTNGADQLRGEFGDDILCGGPGNDKLFGWGAGSNQPGDGADVLVGGTGEDTLQGGFGPDVLIGDDEDFAPGTTQAPHWGHETDDQAVDHCEPYDPSRSNGCEPLKFDTSGGPETGWSGADSAVGLAAYVTEAQQACISAVGKHGQLITVFGLEYQVHELYQITPTGEPSDTQPRTSYVIQGSGTDLVVGTESADEIHDPNGHSIVCGMGGHDVLQPAPESSNDIFLGGEGIDVIAAGPVTGDIDLLVGDREDFELMDLVGRDLDLGNGYSEVVTAPGFPLQGHGPENYCSPNERQVISTAAVFQCTFPR